VRAAAGVAGAVALLESAALFVLEDFVAVESLVVDRKGTTAV